jgi:hypothetical protein
MCEQGQVPVSDRWNTPAAPPMDVGGGKERVAPAQHVACAQGELPHLAEVVAPLLRVRRRRRTAGVGLVHTPPEDPRHARPACYRSRAAWFGLLWRTVTAVTNSVHLCYASCHQRERNVGQRRAARPWVGNSGHGHSARGGGRPTVPAGTLLPLRSPPPSPPLPGGGARGLTNLRKNPAQNLVDMGFPEDASRLALEQTSSRSLEVDGWCAARTQSNQDTAHQSLFSVTQQAIDFMMNNPRSSEPAPAPEVPPPANMAQPAAPNPPQHQVRSSFDRFGVTPERQQSATLCKLLSAFARLPAGGRQDHIVV